MVSRLSANTITWEWIWIYINFHKLIKQEDLQRTVLPRPRKKFTRDQKDKEASELKVEECVEEDLAGEEDDVEL